jgi:hypothetical protein
MTYNRYRCPKCQKVYWFPMEAICFEVQTTGTPSTVGLGGNGEQCPDCGTECVEESEE